MHYLMMWHGHNMADRAIGGEHDIACHQHKWISKDLTSVDCRQPALWLGMKKRQKRTENPLFCFCPPILSPETG